MSGFGFNGSVNAERRFSNIRISDILNDEEIHEFKIIDTRKHTEKQKKAFKYKYDPKINFYYVLSYIDKDNKNWTTDTTFNQATTRSIFNEIEYYNKNVNKNINIENISIQLDKSGKYNKYFVQILKNKESYNSNIEELFNNFKKTLELIKYANMDKKQLEQFNNKFGSDSIADYEIMTDDIVKFINLINAGNHDEILNINIDMLTNHSCNTINNQIKEIRKLKATQKYFNINKYTNLYVHKRFRELMGIDDDEYLSRPMREIEDKFNKYIEEVNKCKDIIINYCYRRI